MRGLVITGGEGPSPEALREIAGQADLLVAADSGLAAAEDTGLSLDLVVGDMDSLDYPARLGKYPPERVIRYPPEKDFTDTEIAIAALKERGCGEVWLAGGGGGRIDHLFAIRALFEREDAPDRWYTEREEIRCLREGGALGVAVRTGSLVSVFPLGEGPWEAASIGLKWPLSGLAWKRGGGGLGLSNVATEGHFEVRAVQGRFMVIWGAWLH